MWGLIRGAMRGAAVAALLAGCLAAVDVLTASPMAGESALMRARAILAADLGAGLALGAILGLVARRRLQAGRPALDWVAGLVVLGALGLSLPSTSDGSTVRTEAVRAWNLEQELPRLGAQTPRGVLLLSLDTVRGDGLDKMPRLQARLQSATVFSSARATSSWTLPSMASVHTGLAYPAHGAGQAVHSGTVVVHTGLDPDKPVLAEDLSQRGFITAAVTTNPFNGQRYGFHRGFDRFVDLSRHSLRRHALRRASLVRAVVPALSDRGDFVTEQLLEWLPLASEGRFFLWAHYLDAHAPYSAAPGALDPLGDCEPPDCFNDWASVRRGTRVMDEQGLVQVRSLYDSDLDYLDQELERVFQTLDALGLWETTLVVLVADHGEAFGEGGEVEHGGSFRDTVVRVPLAFWVPGEQGRVSDRAVDIRLVRSAVLAWADGAPSPLRETQDMLTPFGSLLFNQGEGCTDGSTKLLKGQSPAGPQEQTYDLRADPLEERPQRRPSPQLERCIQQAAQDVGHGIAGDVGALRAMGYIQ